jgi:hypothetical protein
MQEATVRIYRDGFLLSLTAVTLLVGCGRDDTPTSPGQGTPTVTTISHLP